VSRSMVGLLAAVGAMMSTLIAIIHGDVFVIVIALGAGTATGLAACLALPSLQKRISYVG
jgi:hypothetical protein